MEPLVSITSDTTPVTVPLATQDLVVRCWSIGVQKHLVSMELLASSPITHIGASANLAGLVCFVMYRWSHVKMLHPKKVSK